MHSWTTIIVLVVVFAFAVEFRPLDHFMTTYLTSPRVNITITQATDELTRLEDYSSILAVMLIMMITDYLLYKPVMLFNVFCGILVYANLVVLPNFVRLKAAQLCVAFFKSYEVVYFSYLFARVHDKRYYQATSGLARTAMLLGKFCSLLFARTLVYLNGNVYVKELPCYTLGSVVFAFVWASFLPPVRRNKYSGDVIAELMVQNNNEQPGLMGKNRGKPSDTLSVLTRMRRDFKESYTNLIVLKWSVWYCLAVVGYMTIKISDVTHEFGENDQINGVVESLTILTGAIGSYKIGIKRVNWELKGNAFIGAGSLILGVCVTSCYFHRQLLAVHLSYALFGALIQSMFVISLSEISKQLKNKCYALVLSFNSFVSLLLLLFYKEMFIRGNTFKIDIPEQILFFGSVFVVVGTLYLVPCAMAFNRRLKNSCPVYDTTE